MLRRTRALAPGAWSEQQTRRRRVLVEDADGAVLEASRRILERAGFEVAVCSGPEPGRSCPEVTCGSCPLMADADLVYTSLDWNRPEHREVLRAQREHHPDLPVVVEICQPRVAQVGDLLDGCEVVHVPVGSSAMLGAIDRALGAKR